MKVNKDLIQFYTDDLANTLIQKNHDYGNSVQEQFNEYGLTSLLIRLDDKLRRLKTLRTHDPKVVGESLQDTLKDIAGYAILGQICVAHENNEIRVEIDEKGSVPGVWVFTPDKKTTIRRLRRRIGG